MLRETLDLKTSLVPPLITDDLCVYGSVANLWLRDGR